MAHLVLTHMHMHVAVAGQIGYSIDTALTAFPIGTCVLQRQHVDTMLQSIALQALSQYAVGKRHHGV